MTRREATRPARRAKNRRLKRVRKLTGQSVAGMARLARESIALSQAQRGFPESGGARLIPCRSLPRPGRMIGPGRGTGGGRRRFPPWRERVAPGPDVPGAAGIGRELGARALGGAAAVAQAGGV